MTKRDVRPSDLEMRVKTLFGQGRTRLNYTLHSPTGVVAFAHREIAGPDLIGSPEEFQVRLLKKIQRLGDHADTDGSQLSASQRNRKLEGLGQDLWRDLFPSEIRSAYREIRRSVRSWTIISDEPWIPWELIKPYDDSLSAEIIDDDFIALRFELTRWLAGDKTPAFRISVTSLAALQTSTDLPLAVRERELLSAIVQAHPLLRDATPSMSSAEDFLCFLATGGAELIHVIGHGMHSTAQAEESGILFQDGSTLRPVDLGGSTATRIGEMRPLVFLNACWAGRQGWSLTRLGGWATRFVGICGCGAFIAPMWPVLDSTAFAFAQKFYHALVRGTPLGQAALEARQHAHRQSHGDPSALAYTIFGHPDARVTFGDSPDDEAPAVSQEAPAFSDPIVPSELRRSPEDSNSPPKFPSGSKMPWIVSATAVLLALLAVTASRQGFLSHSDRERAVSAPSLNLASDTQERDEPLSPKAPPRAAPLVRQPAASSTPEPTLGATATGPNTFEVRSAPGVHKSTLTQALREAAAPLVDAGIEGWTIRLDVETPQITPHEQDGFPWKLCRVVASANARRQRDLLDLGTIFAVNSQVDEFAACEEATQALAKSIVQRFVKTLREGAP